MANIDWDKTSKFTKAEQSPGFSLWQQFHAWQRKINTALKPLGLTQLQFSLLAVIGYLTKNSETVTQQQVASFANIDRMLVSQVVRRLETDGLVVRKPHPSDKRARVLKLSRKGATKLKNSLPIVEATDAEFFEH